MYIYGEFTRNPDRNRERIKPEKSTSLPDWAKKELETNDNFIVINTRTESQLIFNGMRHEWKEIEPNLDT